MAATGAASADGSVDDAGRWWLPVMVVVPVPVAGAWWWWW